MMPSKYSRKPVWAWLDGRWRVGIALRTCKVRGEVRVEVTSAGRRFVVPEDHLAPRPVMFSLEGRPTNPPDSISKQTCLFSLEAA
jgi:hypothetical protein